MSKKPVYPPKLSCYLDPVEPNPYEDFWWTLSSFNHLCGKSQNFLIWMAWQCKLSYCLRVDSWMSYDQCLKLTLHPFILLSAHMRQIQPSGALCQSPNRTCSRIPKLQQLYGSYAPPHCGRDTRQSVHHCSIVHWCVSRCMHHTWQRWHDPTTPSLRQRMWIIHGRWTRLLARTAKLWCSLHDNQGMAISGASGRQLWQERARICHPFGCSHQGCLTTSGCDHQSNQEVCAWNVMSTMMARRASQDSNDHNEEQHQTIVSEPLEQEHDTTLFDAAASTTTSMPAREEHLPSSRRRPILLPYSG